MEISFDISDRTGLGLILIIGSFLILSVWWAKPIWHVTKHAAIGVKRNWRGLWIASALWCGLYGLILILPDPHPTAPINNLLQHRDLIFCLGLPILNFIISVCHGFPNNEYYYEYY